MNINTSQMCRKLSSTIGPRNLLQSLKDIMRKDDPPPYFHIL